MHKIMQLKSYETTVYRIAAFKMIYWWTFSQAVLEIFFYCRPLPSIMTNFSPWTWFPSLFVPSHLQQIQRLELLYIDLMIWEILSAFNCFLCADVFNLLYVFASLCLIHHHPSPTPISHLYLSFHTLAMLCE